MRFAIVIEQTGNHYSAYIPDVPGCVATGASAEKAKALLSEALVLYFRLIRESRPANAQVAYIDIDPERLEIPGNP